MVSMIVLFSLAVAAVLVAIVVYGIRLKRSHEEPLELRGDWWPRFEAEFRAYALRWEASRGTHRRRPTSS